VTLTATLPRPLRDVPECDDMAQLAPKLREKATLLFARMAARGMPCRCAETLRTDARQVFLFGFGRFYDDGRGIVTQSKDADETWHHFGLALDVVHATLGWNAPAEFWVALREEAEALGLTSGADWDRDPTTPEHFVDEPHVQWGPPMRRSPSPRAARLLADGGLAAVWREVGAA